MPIKTIHFRNVFFHNTRDWRLESGASRAALRSFGGNKIILVSDNIDHPQVLSSVSSRWGTLSQTQRMKYISLSLRTCLQSPTSLTWVVMFECFHYQVRLLTVKLVSARVSFYTWHRYQGISLIRNYFRLITCQSDLKCGREILQNILVNWNDISENYFDVKIIPWWNVKWNTILSAYKFNYWTRLLNSISI